MKKILQLKLKILSKLILKKYQPIVIGITGSIGKTSAKDAIYEVLKDKLRVRTSIKNYNNEIGLPLTIIGQESPGRSLIGWFFLLFKALGLCLFRDRNYPQVLVLEMGVDRPGDMDYLTSIAPVNVGVVTAVSYSHIEYFGSIVNIKKEKQVIIEKLQPKGLAILNFDNEYTKEMASVSKERILSYGLKEGANLQAQDIVYNFTKVGYDLFGINFKLNYNGSIVPVTMKNVMAETALYAALAAAAVALYFDFNLVEVAQALSNFSLPKGRMNLLPGIKHTFIIDDTYNSSPEAALAAVDVLGRIKVDETADKYAIMGDMLEIGSYTEEGHQLVGKKIATSGINQLIAVGEKARGFIRGAKEAGMEDDYIFYFDHPEEAGHFLQNRIKAGDVLLIKGSQGARMEKVVKELMAEPERAAELIVRQGNEWENK
ncbi:MAG: UDP-N-acetylmuramoyl-tripeptide--D-alanyl-D-alanine ligase [Candidatus Falkowbacteria bacterium]